MRVAPTTRKRCSWVNEDDPLLLKYHDQEWGVPAHGDKKHFEILVLSGAQAGLNWSFAQNRASGAGSESHLFNQLSMVFVLHSNGCTRSRDSMTLRIERVQGRIRLIGQFCSWHLDQLKAEIDRCGASAVLVLDLEELDLIDVEGVRFLNACEAKGISVLHESPYIRKWMSQERS